MGEQQDELRVVVNENGNRVVSWPVELADGPVIFRHDFPDALQHHYHASAVESDVCLYQGEFSLEGDTGYTGDVRWRWGPTPRVEARGTRPVAYSDLRNLFSVEDGDMWVQTPRLGIELPGGALPQQGPEPVTDVPNQGRSIRTRVEQELGDSVALERVTFFVPNGWQGHDGSPICDSGDLTSFWYGRTEAAGGGWRVVLDRCAEMDADAWRELQDLNGHRFTHVGQLTRDDGSPFSGREAFDALDRVRVGFKPGTGTKDHLCVAGGVAQ